MKRMLLLSLLVTLAACQRPPMVMPTMFEAGRVAPLADTPEAWQSNPHTIFYATDRVFDREADKTGMYTTKRNDSLSLGRLQIELDSDDAWSKLNAATQAKPEGKQPRPEIKAILRDGQMPWRPAGQAAAPPSESPERTFIEQLDTAAKQSSGKAINIYIHGFKNSFEEAALTTAELSLYSGGLGPYILYSWPSLDSLFEYSHDRDSVRYTTAHARRFIELLANEIAAGRLSATRINLIAHSSGAEVVGSVLRELGLMSHTWTPEQRQHRWKIGDVLLIAPDISTDVARERVLKEDLRGMYGQIVVYTSSNDTALQWASRVLYRTPRIGSIQEEQLTDADRRWLTQADRLTLVNVDDEPNSDPVDHSHHRFSGAALSDILLCLRSDLPPAERGLVRDEDQIIWRFAEDYEQRATQAAVSVYGQLGEE
ncbi:MAG: alpha/beta hydrolase [Planctomycetota bacterium]